MVEGSGSEWDHRSESIRHQWYLLAGGLGQAQDSDHKVG